MIVCVFPNRYNDGKAHATYFHSEAEMTQRLIEDMPDTEEFPPIIRGPIIEEIDVRFVDGFSPIELAGGEERETALQALVDGFEQLKAHEFAQQLDHSWGFDMWHRGELEDESGMYDRQMQSHRDRWKRIGQGLRAYFQAQPSP